MAALASHSHALQSLAPRLSLRSLTLSLRPSWSIPCEASSSVSPSSLASPQSQSQPQPEPVATITIPYASTSTSTSLNAQWFALPALFPSLSALLEQLLPPIVWASVPKKKTSHSRKSMRSANKGLKNKTNLSLCEACGSIKLTHHVCPTCYSQISRRWKSEARGEVQPLAGLGLGEGSP